MFSHSQECPERCPSTLHAVRTQSLTSFLDRIISNFQQVQLSKEDYEAITAIGKGNHLRFNTPFRYCTTADPKWDINIFDEEDEKAASHQVIIA